MESGRGYGCGWGVQPSGEREGLPPCTCRLQRWGGPGRITAQRIRHIFVTFVMNSSSTILANIDQLAATMGNTPRLWSDVYDVTCNQRDTRLSNLAFAKITKAIQEEMAADELAGQLEAQAMVDEDVGPAEGEGVRPSEVAAPPSIVDEGVEAMEEDQVVESEGEDSEFGGDFIDFIDLTSEGESVEG